MRLCLDTTLLSGLVRRRQQTIEASLKWFTPGDDLATTEINYLETSLGIELEASNTLRGRYYEAYEKVLGGLEVLPLTRSATRIAVNRQANLRAKGRPAGFADLLVAAIAKAEGCDGIVTQNARDFKRIGLLKIFTY